MVHAVIFDLDGTLLNTVNSMAEAGNIMLAHLGLPPQPAASYRYFAGNGSRVLVQRALAAANASPTQSIEQAHQLYIASFARTCTHQVAPYPGVLPLLNQLQRLGIQTAVLSNKPHQQTLDVVARFFPQGLFQTIRGQVEGVPLKPNPQAVYTILESLAAHPSHCLYVGDTGVDMQTGQNAGLATVGVEWGFLGRKELEQFHASHIIKEPRELLKLL